MRIGIQLGIHGHKGTSEHPAPRWADISRQAQLAEAAGFDLCFVDDALVDAGMGTHGYWDPAVVLGALAVVTERIGLAHSVVNPQLHHPAVVARMATTLDEICGGRYTVGIGAGNTPADYETFGIPTDRRYSRAAEAIEVIVGLLRTGSCTFDGEFVSIGGGELTPRGPSEGGPPVVVGARGPKMTRLAARLADGWNSWTPEPQSVDAFRPLVEEVERACEDVGRDPATLSRSLDLAVDAHALIGAEGSSITPFLVTGDGPAALADQLLAYGKLGIDEVRCMLWPDRPAGEILAITEAMAPVVELVHQG